MKKPIRFYFSFRSPYSWIAFRQLEERIGFDPERMEYIPFWEPDGESKQLLEARGREFLYAPMSREKHLYILQDIKRLVGKFGLTMAWPVDKKPWWELPHLGFLYANRRGRGHAFIQGVYKARWEEGADISLPETIAKVAENVGLDPQAVLAAPQDPAIRAEGTEALYRCVQDGVFGVPFFIHGYQKFWGIDRLDDFITAIAPVWDPDYPNGRGDGILNRRPAEIINEGG